MNKLIIASVVVVVAVAGYFVFSKGNNKGVADSTVSPTLVPSISSSVSPKSSPQVTKSPAATTGPKAFSLADVSVHSNATSCYSAINGSVYDLTAWIKQHPGGAGKILSICGKDGSSAFSNQHGVNQKELNILATFKIGTLSQ